MSITMPDVAATRFEMLTAYRRGLADIVEESTTTLGDLRAAMGDAVLSPEDADEALTGLRVVVRKDVDEAITAIFSQLVPMPIETTAEVHTPATIIVSAICPRCSLAQPIAMTINPELLIDDSGSELRIKAKAKGRTHICGQMPLPVHEAAGQEPLPFGDDEAGDDSDDEDDEVLQITAGDVDFGEGAPNAEEVDARETADEDDAEPESDDDLLPA